MEVIIDRFEGDYAIVEIEEGKFTELPRILIPEAKEGDCVRITIDQDSTKKRKERITNLMNSLFED